MNETITITIDKIGRPKVEANGFQGGACSLATKPILDALTGNNAKATIVEKAEMHMAATEEEHQHEWN